MAPRGGTLTDTWFLGAPLTFAATDQDPVPLDADVRTVRAGDRHVTLLYLGRVPEEVARRVWSALPAQPLPAELRALRWERFGRTALALDLADELGLLEAAARACHSAAKGVIDLQVPARFRPHVTMARVPRRGRPPAPRQLAAWPVPSEPVGVGALTLFRSDPRSSGDRYEAVARQG